MANWTRWVWPGLISTAMLTATAVWFRSMPVEYDLATRALQRLSTDNAWAGVELDGRDIILKGVAPSPDAQAAAIKQLAEVRGIRLVDDRSTLLPVAEPFSFNALKKGDGITLTGYVPFGLTRVRLIALIEKANPGIKIDDDLALARGNPEGFDTLAGFALSQLCDLAEGEVKLVGSDYFIEGRAVDADAYETLRAVTSGVLPGNGRLVIERITQSDNN